MCSVEVHALGGAKFRQSWATTSCTWLQLRIHVPSKIHPVLVLYLKTTNCARLLSDYSVLTLFSPFILLLLHRNNHFWLSPLLALLMSIKMHQFGICCSLVCELLVGGRFGTFNVKKHAKDTLRTATKFAWCNKIHGEIDQLHSKWGVVENFLNLS